MSAIPVRTMRFDIPESLDPIMIRGEPEESYVNVAMSLILPHLEPYLIRTMKLAKPKVTDPALAAELEAFAGQEGHHYRQHMLLNDAFRRFGIGGGGFPATVQALERRLADDYRRFAKSRSLRFNLAYAEGFEALTSAMALVFLEQDTSKWHPVALDLFQWHLTEELEHRTVAFEVYDHVVGSWPYRIAVGLYAQAHLLRFLVRAAEAMLAADPRVQTEHGGKAGRRAREPRLVRILTRQILPRVARTYRMSYSPRSVVVPERLEALSRQYSGAAVSLREPSPQAAGSAR